MKQLNTAINGDYSYATHNSIEIWLERCIGHNCCAKFSCEATNPEQFMEVATSLLKQNTYMHLRANFGVEYSNDTNARGDNVDENNVCVLVSFDVDPDPEVNQHRLERFLDMVIEGINLCDFKIWRPYVERKKAEQRQITITLDADIVEKLEKKDGVAPLSMQVEKIVQQSLA